MSGSERGRSGGGKGRGAVSNRSARYLSTETVAFDDGWGDGDGDAEPRRLPTVVTPEVTRTAITRNQSPDVPFSRSLNPYKGCEHGCIYCFARPTHAYLDLSPGLDFETRIFSKPDAPERLAHELSRPGYQCEMIALGANTDPYQPIERELGITRRVIEVLAAHHHPFGIVTKSNLVLRDLDLLAPLAERRLVHVLVSVTTLDDELARRMEPRAPRPERRLDAIRRLADAGVPVGVLASPMIPALNDAELERILEAATAAGARSAGYILVRLPLEIKDLFDEWLAEHYPLRAERVLSLIRDTRDGALYDARFGTRMKGTGVYADLLARRFAVATQRLGLAERLGDLDHSQFRVPPRAGDQLRLF